MFIYYLHFHKLLPYCVTAVHLQFFKFSSPQASGDSYVAGRSVEHNSIQIENCFLRHERLHSLSYIVGIWNLSLLQ